MMRTIWRTVALLGVAILIGLPLGYWAGSDEQVDRIKEWLSLAMVGLGLLAAILYGFAHVANRFMKQRDRKDAPTAASETSNTKEPP